MFADFSQAEGDTILLAQIDAIAGGADDAFSFVGTDAFSKTADELRYAFDGSGNTVVEYDIDGDGAVDTTLILTGEIDLVAANFLL